MRRTRPLLSLLFISCLVALIIPQRPPAVLALAAPYSGAAQINGPLHLDLSVSPAVARPGDVLLLEARLRNETQVTVTPQVAFNLPANLSIVTKSMPTGATLNLQSNALNWLPVVSAGGGEQTFKVELRVETADMTQAEQTITAVLKHQEQEQRATVTLWIGIAPQIRNIILPQASVGQPIQLKAEMAGRGPFIQSWQLGDGRRIEVNDPIVVYPAAGTYEITLEVANPLTTSSHSGTITVVPHPVAQFALDDFTPGVTQTITFINQSGGQPPLNYSWDFGDGTTSDAASPTHQYDAAGSYEVRLVVDNAYGQSEGFWVVPVGLPPVADMEIDEAAPAGQPVNGQAFGDETVTLFRWSMGDGRTYEGEQISHAYRQMGDYYVVLTAENEFGATEIGRWVHVDAGWVETYFPLITYNEPSVQPLEPDGSLDSGLALDLEPVALEEPFAFGDEIVLPENSTPTEQLFYLVNEARRTFSLSPLNQVYELDVAAQQHAEDMAANSFTAHVGSDGSLPVERLLFAGYGSGYAGEATAWGFRTPQEAVEFWINSPGHRRIILNRFATDLGVGFKVDYTAPNVWYWTAEFGNVFEAAIQPALRLQQPQAEQEALVSDVLTYGWNWPLPLGEGQQFTVYLIDGRQLLPVGVVSQPARGTYYTLPAAATGAIPTYLQEAKTYEWQVKLEDENGATLAQSDPLTLVLNPDFNLPTPTLPVTATITPTVAVPTTPTPTATTTPAATPRPAVPTRPVVVTVTPTPAE